MLSNYDYNKLLHDLKRASRCLKLIREESLEEKRNMLVELLSNELDRMYEDLEEIKKSNGNNKILDSKD